MTVTGVGDLTPRSMFGTDLTLSRLPDWLREAGLYRISAMRPGANVWRVLYRIAIDEGPDLSANGAHVLRVVLDRHTDYSDDDPGRCTSVVMTTADIGHRTRCSRRAVFRALAELADGGWLSRVEQTGRPSILTLLVPLDPCHGGTGTPCHTGTTPCHTDTGPVPRWHDTGDRRRGDVPGDARVDWRDRDRRAPVPWCDPTCAECGGLGWVQYGDDGRTSAPCPERVGWGAR